MGFGAAVIILLLAIVLICLLPRSSYSPPILTLPPPHPEELEEQRREMDFAILREKARYQIAAKERFYRDNPYSKSHTPIDPVKQVCLTCGLTMGKIYMDQVYCSGKWGEVGPTLNQLWVRMQL